MRSACREGSTGRWSVCTGQAHGGREGSRARGPAGPRSALVHLPASSRRPPSLSAGPAPQSLCTCTRSTDVRSRAAAHCAIWRPPAGGRAQPSQQLRTKVRSARRRSGQVSPAGGAGGPGGPFPGASSLARGARRGAPRGSWISRREPRDCLGCLSAALSYCRMMRRQLHLILVIMSVYQG